MKNCKHNHECEQCVREAIKKHREEIAKLEEKLPRNDLELFRHLMNMMPKKEYVPVPMPYPRWIGSHGTHCACLQCTGNIVWRAQTSYPGGSTTLANYKVLGGTSN